MNGNYEEVSWAVTMFKIAGNKTLWRSTSFGTLTLEQAKQKAKKWQANLRRIDKEKTRKTKK